MALNKDDLKRDIKNAFLNLVKTTSGGVSPTDSVTLTIDHLADDLTNSIDSYVKSASVKIPDSTESGSLS